MLHHVRSIGIRLLVVCGLAMSAGIKMSAQSAGSGAVAATTASASAPAASGPPSSSATVDGWQALKIPKSEAEKAETARLLGEPLPVTDKSPRGSIFLPAQRSSIRGRIGIGYVTGADWAGDVGAAGSWGRVNVDAATFATVGQQGFRLRSGRIALSDPERRWSVEGGDLFTELRGLSRGARVAVAAGPFGRPTLSMYAPGTGLQRDRSTVSFANDFKVLPHFSIGGEIASDGSLFVRPRISARSLDLEAFFRQRDGAGERKGRGLLASYDIWRGVTLRAGVRLSAEVADSGLEQSTWRLIGLRIPVARSSSVALERTLVDNPRLAQSSNALMLQLPLGPVRLFQRVQWGQLDYLQRDFLSGLPQRQMQTIGSYSPTRWASLNLQASTQWRADGSAQQWEEFRSVFKVSRTTIETVTAVPHLLEPSRLRGRVTYRTQSGFSWIAEYGRLSAFQHTREVAGERSRFLLMAQRDWNVKTPARGGEVLGRALDQVGSPVPGAVVRLGPYQTTTDERGWYHFRFVPRGTYQLFVDPDKLPADYAADTARHTLTIGTASLMAYDFTIVPLYTIFGCVYWDKNNNSHLDPGEELAGAVLRLGEAATVTDARGTFGFYNQPPGVHQVRLEAPRLPAGFTPMSPTELDVTLTVGGAASRVEFRVDKQDKKILMKGLSQ